MNGRDLRIKLGCVGLLLLAAGCSGGADSKEGDTTGTLTKSPGDPEHDGEDADEDRATAARGETGNSDEEADDGRSTSDELPREGADSSQNVASESSGPDENGNSSVPGDSEGPGPAAGDVNSEPTESKGGTEGSGDAADAEPSVPNAAADDAQTESTETDAELDPDAELEQPKPTPVDQLPDEGAMGEVLWTEVLTEMELTMPVDVAADATGAAYVLGDQYTTRRGDMRVIKYSPDGAVEWSHLLVPDHTGETYAGNVSVGPDGAVYATGAYGSWPNNTGVLNKYDAEGELAWSQTIEALDGTSPMGVATDSEGGLVVTGSTYPISGGSSGAQQPFLISYGPDGEADWSLIWDAERIGFGSEVAISETGDVLLTGMYFAESSGHFLAKFDREGTLIWERTFTTGASGWDVVVDAQGIAYLGAASETETLLQAFDPEGELLWSEQWSGYLGEFAIDVALDAYGNVFASSTLDGFERKAELRKFDASGELLWMQQWETDGDFTAEGLAVAGTGHLFVTGNAHPNAEDAPYSGSYLRRFR